MTKKTNPVNKNNIGRLFFKPGEDVPYRLNFVQSEPYAVMEQVSKHAEDVDVLNCPISEFKDFILLPENESKKPRTDLGGTHRRKKQASSTSGQEINRQYLVDTGVRTCPIHKVALLARADKCWECPEENCTTFIQEQP